MMQRTANAAGALLLLAVVVVHFRIGSAAEWLHPGQAYVERSLFYVLRGVLGAAVFAALLLLAPRAWLLTLACTVGMLAEGATALCRVAWPLTAPVPRGANAGGLCDEATREPITALLAGAVLAALILNNKKGAGHG